VSSLRQSCAPRRCRASACSSSRTCRSARIDRRRGMAGGTGLREPQCAHILPPVCGVSAYAETIPRDTARLEERIARLLQSIGWSGIFQVQFIRRRQALPHRLEPRIVGSLALPVAAGLNLRAIWVDLLLGRRPGRQRRSRRDRFRSEEKDAVALLGAFARRQFREGSAGSFHGGEPCTPLSLGGCRSLGASPRSVVCNRLPVQGAGSYLVEPPTHVVNA